MLNSRLSDAESYVRSLEAPEAEKQALISAVTAAKAEPSKGTIGQVLSALTNLTAFATAASGAEDKFSQIIQGISTLAGFN
jgi:hypothetical protein